MGKHDPSKTEAPTPKRKKEARKEGRVAKSPDLFAWVAILVSTILVPGVVQRLGASLTALLSSAGEVARHPDSLELPTIVGQALMAVFTGLAPFFIALMVLGIATGLAQVGFMFSPTALKPKLSRLSLGKGLKRMFSIQGVWGAAAAVMRIAVMITIVYLLIDELVQNLVIGSGRSARDSLTEIASASVTIIRAVAAVAVAIAVADYVIKKRSLMSDMRMTKDEVRREMRESDGDPHVKARLRSMRMAMGRNRMLADIGSADVVIANPTHFAVAISYNRQKGAPRVVARGADTMAARIRGIAAEEGVPCVEAQPLARALYKVCRPGEEIPPELYQGVAVVLAFLHRLGEAHAALGSNQIRVEVPDTCTPSGGALDRVSPAQRRIAAKRAQISATQGIVVSADRNAAVLRPGEVR